MMHKPPIDWHRLLATAERYTPEELARLNARISQWEAMSELAGTKAPLEAFDLNLIDQTRYFLSLVKAADWEAARSAYPQIQQMRQELNARNGLVLSNGKIKPVKPVKTY
jgi:hypothetical protein